VSAVNKTYNIDFTTEKGNRKLNNRKRKTTVSPEWKRNKTKSLRNTEHKYRTFKRGTGIAERKIANFGGH
jgi:hypothetical protein